MSKKSTSTLTGTVRSFNLSPKGQVEGALVEGDTGTVQLNFPKPEAELLAQSMRVGSKVKVQAEWKTDEFEHSVYDVLPAPTEVQGKVSRLNYALHGEVNGFVLDNGTFVHLKPEGARKYKVRVGAKVRVTGQRREGPAAIVLEAAAVKLSERAKERTTRA